MNCPVLKCRHNTHAVCHILETVELDENGRCKYVISPLIDPDTPPKIVYLCDRRACAKCNRFDCHHTSDINHAINFIKGLDGNFTENEVDLDDH